MISIEEFKKLKRDEMFTKLAALAPEKVKGKSRAKKEDLVDLYEELLKEIEEEKSVLAPPELPLSGDDAHTAVANAMFEGVTTGRFSSAGPSLSKASYDEMLKAYEEALKRGEDPYTAAAAVMFGVEVSAVTPEQRHAAKTPLFAHIYGRDASKMEGELEKDALAIQTAYPKSGDQALLGLAMQNIPLRTEEAKELRDALVEKAPDLGVDYASLEQRVMSERGIGQDDFSPAEARMVEAMGLGGVAQATMDAYDREKPYGGGLPHGTAVLDGHETSVGTGVEGTVVNRVPLGVVVSRRETVARAVSKLGRDRIMVIAQYRAIPKNGNRKQRKTAEALRRQINRFLPKGVTLDEAMAVLG